MRTRYKFSFRWLFRYGYFSGVRQCQGDHRFYGETVWSPTLIPGLYWTEY